MVHTCMLHGYVPLNEPDLNVNILRSEDVRRAWEAPFLLQFHPMQKIVMPDLFVTTDRATAALLALLAPLLIRNPFKCAAQNRCRTCTSRHPRLETASLTLYSSADIKIPEILL